MTLFFLFFFARTIVAHEQYGVSMGVLVTMSAFAYTQKTVYNNSPKVQGIDEVADRAC
jgi:hypothetical protein